MRKGNFVGLLLAVVLMTGFIAGSSVVYASEPEANQEQSKESGKTFIDMIMDVERSFILNIF